jgi:hypothetical protein
MAPKTRQQVVILSVLLAILLAVLVFNREADPVGATATSPVRLPVAAKAGAGGTVEAVRLDALSRQRPEPQAGDRNPFRFRPVALPPPPVAARPVPGGPGSPLAAGPPVPEGPPPPPPIALKFIGTVEQAPSRLKLAVLSDGRNVFYGKEGEVIEGRYRIVRIGVESIEMVYVDGRGRQTLRLSGS